MENQKLGYVPLYRSIKKKPWAKDVFLRTLWDNLLLDAARKPFTANFKGHQWNLQPGQLVVTSDDLGLAMCDRKGVPTSRHAVERMLAFFEKEGMISVVGERRKGTVITIINYAEYAEKIDDLPAHNSAHISEHNKPSNGVALSGGASAGAGAVSGTASSASAGAMGMSTSFRAYDVGGYTGDGGKFEPKGVVHGGEFVFTKEATNRIGIDNLYKMMRGYADGGLVSNAVTATAPMLGMQGGGNNITVGIGDVVIMSDSQKENNASNSQDIGAGIQKQLKPAIVATISEQLRIPGTPLWMAMNGNR